MTTILQRIAAGDESAVDECVREYGDLVWRIARRHLDRAGAEVEDAVQEVFVEIWNSARRFDPSRGGEAAFVATLAHRRVIDRQRQETTRRRHHARAAESAPVRSLGAGAATHADDAAHLARVFDELPDTEREALWMSVYGGMSHRDIGVATESPIGTVKSRLRRAMTRLTDALVPSGEGAR